MYEISINKTMNIVLINLVLLYLLYKNMIFHSSPSLLIWLLVVQLYLCQYSHCKKRWCIEKKHRLLCLTSWVSWKGSDHLPKSLSIPLWGLVNKEQFKRKSSRKKLKMWEKPATSKENYFNLIFPTKIFNVHA